MLLLLLLFLSLTAALVLCREKKIYENGAIEFNDQNEFMNFNCDICFVVVLIVCFSRKMCITSFNPNGRLVLWCQMFGCVIAFWFRVAVAVAGSSSKCIVWQETLNEIEQKNMSNKIFAKWTPQPNCHLAKSPKKKKNKQTEGYMRCTAWIQNVH